MPAIVAYLYSLKIQINNQFALSSPIISSLRNWLHPRLEREHITCRQALPNWQLYCRPKCETYTDSFRLHLGPLAERVPRRQSYYPTWCRPFRRVRVRATRPYLQ